MAERGSLRSLLRAQLHDLLGKLGEEDVPAAGYTATAVDEFYEVYLCVRPRQPPPPCRAPEADTSADTVRRLRPIEADTCEAAGDRPLTARQLADKAGYPLNSYYRETLSWLCRNGFLRHVHKAGYVRTDKPLPAA